MKKLLTIIGLSTVLLPALALADTSVSISPSSGSSICDGLITVDYTSLAGDYELIIYNTDTGSSTAFIASWGDTLSGVNPCTASAWYSVDPLIVDPQPLTTLISTPGNYAYVYFGEPYDSCDIAAGGDFSPSYSQCIASTGFLSQAPFTLTATVGGTVMFTMPSATSTFSQTAAMSSEAFSSFLPSIYIPAGVIIGSLLVLFLHRALTKSAHKVLAPPPLGKWYAYDGGYHKRPKPAYRPSKRFR